MLTPNRSMGVVGGSSTGTPDSASGVGFVPADHARLSPVKPVKPVKPKGERWSFRNPGRRPPEKARLMASQLGVAPMSLIVKRSYVALSVLAAALAAII